MLEARKALIESEAYKAKLNVVNAPFKKGHNTTMDLMAKAAMSTKRVREFACPIGQYS